LSMRMRTSMRVDFKKLKEEKKAGTVLIATLIIGALLAVALIKYETAIASTYVSSNSYSIYNIPAFEKVLEENKYVAVMFRSLTCPHCEEMMPYWMRLEMSNSKVKFVDVVYDTNTAELFQRYGIEGTPTFILFVEGKPVLRHEGIFVGENVTDVMYQWAMQGVGGTYIPGYSTFVAKCSACHGAPTSLDREGLLAWLRSERTTLGRMLLEAYNSGKTLSEYLGGAQAIEQAIRAMAQRNGLAFDEATVKETAKFLEGVSEVLLGKEAALQVKEAGAATALPQGQAAPLVMLLAGLAAGVGAAISPCNFPLFVTYVTRSLREKKAGALRAASCALAAAVGVGILGATFLLFSTAVLEVQKVLIPVVGALIVGISLASLLKVPIEMSAGRLGRVSGGTFCFIYGFLSVQCNLPLVIGALLLIAAGGGLSTLLGFTVGVAVPLFLAGWAGPRLRGLAERLTRNAEKVETFTSFLMLLAGIYLVFYGAGLA